jgi:hypothetical protein
MDDEETLSDDPRVKNNEIPKKRGRKKEDDEYYFQRALDKIDEIKKKLKTAKQDGMKVSERQRLRN